MIRTGSIDRHREVALYRCAGGVEYLFAAPWQPGRFDPDKVFGMRCGHRERYLVEAVAQHHAVAWLAYAFGVESDDESIVWLGGAVSP